MAEHSNAGGSASRDTFTSKTAFIIACVGSAVGMANIWLFPYRVAEFGGAAYLIPYFVCVAVLGFSGVIGEMAFGRAMGAGPMGAFSKAMEMRGIENGKAIGRVIGAIPTLGSLAIAIGYAVVLGWALRYLVMGFTGELAGTSDIATLFGGIASDFGNVPFHIAGLALTFAVMLAGVSHGIERINKVMMPLFFVLFLIVLVRVITLPGAGAGFEYLLVPQWMRLLTPRRGSTLLARRSSGCLWQEAARLCTAATSRRTSTWFPPRATWPSSARLPPSSRPRSSCLRSSLSAWTSPAVLR